MSDARPVDDEEEEDISPFERPITEVTVEDVEVTCRDFVKFATHFFSLRRILRVAGYVLLFLLIGYAYKLWLWVDLCVLHSADAPCRDDYSLFASPYPVNLGVIYGEDVSTSGSFFTVDKAHMLCCFRGGTYVTMAYGVFWLLRRYLYPRLRAHVARFKQDTATTRRRVLVRKNK